MHNITNPPLLPLRSMARRLGVPLSWLRAEAENGRIPALRAGRAWLCDPTAVEAALLARARQAAAPQQEVEHVG
jgi:excisionase family DNA binding protein